MGQLIQQFVGRLRHLHPAWIFSALTALLAAGGFYLLRENNALRIRMLESNLEAAALRVQTRRAVDQAATLERRATELDSQLGAAKSQGTASGTKNTQLTRELAETKTRLSKRAQSEIALMTELAVLKQKLGDTESNAKLPASPPTETAAAPTLSAPAQNKPQIEVYTRRIAQLEQQLAELLSRRIEGNPTQVDPGAVDIQSTEAPPTHTLVRVGPRDSFVIIDYGAEQGAVAGMIISIWRGTTVLAHARISDTRPRLSVAQVLPASLKGQLQPGDLVLFK